MAFDFPASPTNGTVSNGYTWSAAAGMWVGGPGVSGPVTEQYFDLSGKTAQAITVPSWAKGAELTLSVMNSSAGTGQLMIRTSSDGTTFAAGATNYWWNLPYHAETPPTWSTGAGAQSSALVIGYVGQNMLLPHMVEATITLERKATNEVFGYRSHCRMIHSTQGITAAWYAGYVGDVTHGSALRLAALQLSFSNAAVMGNGSWVKVRWLGDSAAIPATNAIADAPNDAFVYMRGQNAWKSGGTLSGDLTISKAGPYLFLNKAASGQSSVIWGQTAAKNRWSIELGHAAGEGGSNSGSDFVVARWDDAGAYINQPLVISRATGDATFSGFIGIGCAPTAYPGAGNTTVGCNVLPTGQLFASTAANPPIYANVNVDGWLASLSRAGVAKGSISVSATAVSFNTTSDGRLKEDRKAFDAGPLIDATNVYDFLWKDTTTRGYGVVAQEAIAVLPDAVNHNEEQDSWGVDYSKYVPLLLQEVKALRARVAELEAA